MSPKMIELQKVHGSNFVKLFLETRYNLLEWLLVIVMSMNNYTFSKPCMIKYNTTTTKRDKPT